MTNSSSVLTVPFMTYDSYNVLNKLIESEKEKLLRDYHAALTLSSKLVLSPSESPKAVGSNKSATLAIIKGYQTYLDYFLEIQKQLRYAFQEGCNPSVKAGGFFNDGKKK